MRTTEILTLIIIAISIGLVSSIFVHFSKWSDYSILVGIVVSIYLIFLILNANHTFDNATQKYCENCAKKGNLTVEYCVHCGKKLE